MDGGWRANAVLTDILAIMSIPFVAWTETPLAFILLVAVCVSPVMCPVLRLSRFDIESR
jgi:hypothetical protein